MGVKMRTAKGKWRLVLAGIGLLATAAVWFAWPHAASKSDRQVEMPTEDRGVAADESQVAKPRDPRDPRDTMSGSSASALRPRLGRAADKASLPKTFRLNREHEDKNRTNAKVRKFANQQWDKFVLRANPTEEQQQAILAAVYDAQLYYEEIRAMEAAWVEDWAPSGNEANSGPFPDTNWMEEVNTSISDRAKEVLDEKQFKTFWILLDQGLVLAVPGKFVESADEG